MMDFFGYQSAFEAVDRALSQLANHGDGDSDRLPTMVWTVESRLAGPLGIYADRETARTAAERAARRKLTWLPSVVDRDGEMALHDGSRPTTSDIYLIAPRSVIRSSDQPDPHGYHPAPAGGDPERAATVYRVLTRGLHHGPGTPEDCPLCETSTDPRMRPEGWQDS